MRCKLDPSLKAPPGFKVLIVKKGYGAFNLNPFVSELAPLHPGGAGGPVEGGDVGVTNLHAVRGEDEFWNVLHAHRAKALVVINFGASWCTHCLKLLPEARVKHAHVQHN